MSNELNENNISITLQSAMDRLSAINGRVSEKEKELEKTEKDKETAKSELDSLQKSVDTLKNNKKELETTLDSLKKEIEVTRETLRAEYEKGIGKLEALYQKLCDAKEALLKTITENVTAKEKETFSIIDAIQEKRRTLSTLEKEVVTVTGEIEHAKKNMFNLQTKFDDLRQKEEFIKRKYEDAGIPYVPN